MNGLWKAKSLPGDCQERFGWIIYKYLRAHMFEIKTYDVLCALSTYLRLDVERPSLLHSQILILAMKYYKSAQAESSAKNSKMDLKLLWAHNFYNFLLVWNLEFFRDEDWRAEVGADGTQYKPLALKALKLSSDALSSMPKSAPSDVSSLLICYEKAVALFPEDEWLLRDYAKLYLHEGSVTEARKIYERLILMLPDKYYIWQEFAGCWSEPDVRIALLCKAISLERNEDFVGKIRVSLARALIDTGLYAEARCELALYKKHYERKSWRVGPDFVRLFSKVDKPGVELLSGNKGFYAAQIDKAEEIAYSNVPCVMVALVDIWKRGTDRMFSFANSSGLSFSVKQKRYDSLKKARLGQVLGVKFAPCLHAVEVSGGTPTILLFKQTTEPDWSVLKPLSGVIEYINIDKQFYHIRVPQSPMLFVHYDKLSFSRGDKVAFYTYERRVKDGLRTCVVGLSKK